MDNVIDLISNQDLDAFVDGELTDARLLAVRKKLLADDSALRRVMMTALVNEALRAMPEVVRRRSDFAPETAKLSSDAA